MSYRDRVPVGWMKDVVMSMSSQFSSLTRKCFTLTRQSIARTIESGCKGRSPTWWQVLCRSNAPSFHHTSWCQLEFSFREKGGYTSSKKRPRLTPTIRPKLVENVHDLLRNNFVFQQDGALHRHTWNYANARVTWQTSSDFIDKDSWPPNSPDLNPLDYCVWGAMLEEFNKVNLKP